MGPHSGKVGKSCTHYSNALIENWMRIIKLDIFNSKTNIRPGDFIKTLYPNIATRLSAFRFAFHPRARKVFTQHKRPRKSSEEYCSEELSRKSKKHCGYLQPNNKVSSLCKKIVADAKCSDKPTTMPSKKRPILYSKKRKRLSDLREESTPKIARLAQSSIINDSELVEMDVVHYDLPGFRPPDLAWQIATYKNNNIPFFSSVKYSFNPSIKEENLRNFVPNVVEPINAEIVIFLPCHL